MTWDIDVKLDTSWRREIFRIDIAELKDKLAEANAKWRDNG